MKKPSNRIKQRTKRVAAKKTRNKPLFGTSKLEEDFARDFLDKLGVKYNDIASVIDGEEVDSEVKEKVLSLHRSASHKFNIPVYDRN